MIVEPTITQKPQGTEYQILLHVPYWGIQYDLETLQVYGWNSEDNPMTPTVEGIPAVTTSGIYGFASDASFEEMMTEAVNRNLIFPE